METLQDIGLDERMILKGKLLGKSRVRRVA